MGWITAVLVLVMLDADALHLCVDILVECSSKGCIDDLDAFADAQHGNLTLCGNETLTVTQVWQGPWAG